MSAEAMCPICGLCFEYSVVKGHYQTSSSRMICEDCENDPEIMEWWKDQKRKEAEAYAARYANKDGAKGT